MFPPSEIHRPVMCREAVAFLLGAPGDVFIDATLGDGGHAEALLQNRPEIVLYGIDRDPEAIAFSKNRLSEFGERVKFIQGRFGELREIAKREGISDVMGVLFDLGVSSRQIDTADRGFSFSRGGKLDMRMDPNLSTTAFDIVNSAPREELTRIMATYGEQPRAGRIARAIVVNRKERPIETTTELAEIVRSVIRGATNVDLARVFQAFRIVVNDELGELERGLEAATSILMPDGILVTISYHSLEDRMVKRFIAAEEKGCICPPDLPVCRCGRRPRLERLTKKPLTPGAEEISDNPRARSAKLRAAKRLN